MLPLPLGVPPTLAPHKVFPKTMEFGGCAPPHQMWEMQHRARGLRITKCYPSLVRSMSQHSAFFGFICAVCR